MVDIIVIGGGASGMLAALTASENGENHVTLVERQARVGRKLLSTGNGRCNLTNMDAGVRHYHGKNPEFAKEALERFTPRETCAFFNALGLFTLEEYGGRVYPLSNQANSVLDVLRFALERAGVSVMTGAEVKNAKKEGGAFKVQCAERSLVSEKLIVACGGCAGAKLGGVRDGYEILKGFGHSCTKLYPALTQIRTDTEFPRALKGVRADARITLRKGGKTLAESAGEVLFTDTGVSGTAVFDISREAAMAGARAAVELDFFRDYEREALLDRLKKMISDYPELPANQLLTGTVHNRLGQMLCKYARVGADTKAGALKGAQQDAVVSACKSFCLPITGVSGFDSAQVTSGGIATSEFDGRTLRSRLVPGLYACGEVLDIDGDCGGYNLQWAWSSGRMAGETK